MESSQSIEISRPLAQGRAHVISRSVTQLAHGVSIVFSPPILSVISLLVVAGFLNSAAAWLWVSGEIGLIVGVPCLYVLWLVRQGQASDFDLQIRSQRTRPYTVTLGCLAINWLILYVGDAPRLLLVLGGALFIQMTLLMAITLVWKISLHTAAVASFIALAWALLGGLVSPLVLLIPLIAWARIRLRRHTPLQTLAGAVVGLAVVGIIFATWG